MILYIIQSGVALSLSYLLYNFLLRKDKTFVFNRFYLLATLLLCLIIPAAQLENSFVSPDYSQLTVPGMLESNLQVDELITQAPVERIEYRNATSVQILLWIYIIITAGLILRFVRNITQLSKLTKGEKLKVHGHNVVPVQHQTGAFSFFNNIFINEESLRHKTYSKSMLNHEAVHSQQLHSIDIVIVELVTCFFWFNPLIWLYKRAIVENHEYLADHSVTQAGIAKDEYATRIIESVKTSYPLRFTSGFSYVQTKNRLIMLDKQDLPTSRRIVKFATVILLLGATLVFSSFSANTDDTPFVVVIDAGHGGKDPGSTYNMISEKNLALEISNRIEKINDSKKLKIILTRPTDKFTSLEERIELTEQTNPDLLLSIHFNNSKNSSQQGLEAYYYGEGSFQKESYNYTKILVAKQVQAQEQDADIKTADFFILKNANCPAVLMELGFISNQSYRQQLSDPTYLDTTAKSIYEGLLSIRKESN